MSLADRIPAARKGIDAARLVTILWSGAIGFVVLLTLLFVLQRLGLPMSLVIAICLAAAVLVLGVLAWSGRTMSSAPYFYAGRMAGSTALGVGGINDWISGAFLVLLLSLPLAGQMVLAPALMLGLLMQTSLFALAFQRSGVATLSGFMDWRSRSRTAGFVALLVTITMLGLLIVADYAVLRSTLARLTGSSGAWTMGLVLIIAGLPALLGGWMALVLANGVLAVWMLISVLSPAIATGFFRGALEEHITIAPNTQTLEPLFQTAQSMSFAGGGHAGFIITLFVLACGFATLPHALSRSALSDRPLVAVETSSWSGLCVFLVLSALPLSIGLLGIAPNSPELATLLKGNGVLYALPHLALGFAAFNALTVCIFTFAIAISRALRRTRRLDPGEQSMVPTRIIIAAVLLGLWFLPTSGIPSPGDLLILALSLGAGSLFLPLAVLVWGPKIHRFAGTFAVLAGAATSASFHLVINLSPLEAGAFGMVATAIVLAIAFIEAFFRAGKRDDLRYDQLRNPTPIHE